MPPVAFDGRTLQMSMNHPINKVDGLSTFSKRRVRWESDVISFNGRRERKESDKIKHLSFSRTKNR
jgi:hypothetical protein